MMTFDDALKTVRSIPYLGRSKRVTIDQSLGYVTSEDVFAAFPQPRFDNSAVDGYAIHLDDLSSGLSRFEVLETVAAGSSNRATLRSGFATRVMTGAPVPPGTGAVVMQEDVQCTDRHIRLDSLPGLGTNVRRQGAELREGQLLVAANNLVTAPILSALASNGTAELSVFTRPTVGLMVTGDELARPGNSEGSGQVFESNSAALRPLLSETSDTVLMRYATDTLEETKQTLNDLLCESDVVVTTGGVSVGAFDFVRPALTELGFEFCVPRVAIKPGKPFCCAVRNDGKVAFGLPGNPMSALTTYALFVWPWLRAAAGLVPRAPESAFLTEREDNHGERESFVGGIRRVEEGRVTVTLRPAVGSHSVAGLSRTNVIARLAPASAFAAGELVETYPVPWVAA